MYETCRSSRASCGAAVHAAVAEIWFESRPHTGFLTRGLCDCNTASRHFSPIPSLDIKPGSTTYNAFVGRGQISTATGLCQNILNTGVRRMQMPAHEGQHEAIVGRVAGDQQRIERNREQNDLDGCS